jgi:hypothetical protein
MVVANLGESRVFGQESVAGVNGVAVGDQGGRDNVRNVEIGTSRRPGPDAKGFVGLSHVQRFAIRFGEDCYRRDAEFLTGAIDSQRDLASVGDQYLTKNLSLPLRALSARH